MSHKDFHELSIWKTGFDLLMEIYTIADSFPNSEKFSLTSQLQRSANSIIANIAESHGRYHYSDKVRVLYIARGEVMETRSHLAVALGRKYIKKEKFKSLNNKYTTLCKEMNLYISNLKLSK